jgi:Icc protein
MRPGTPGKGAGLWRNLWRKKMAAEVRRQEAGIVRVLQISDCHLFDDPDGRLLGVNTRESFTAVIEAIRKQAWPADFVLVTGDISQDYSAGSYERFASIVSALGKPVFFIPGNHDDGPLEYRIFGKLGVSTDRHLICGGWQFILLNSEVYSQAHGWVQRWDLDYLRSTEQKYPGLRACVAIHHLPCLVGSAWLDTQTLHNFDEFQAYVRRVPSVQLVVSGHVHQEFDRMIGSVRYIASPSTSIQFMPGSADFELDVRAPGWRTLTLGDDGTIATKVYRLEGASFVPNYSARGY